MQNLAKALLAAQATMPDAVKDSTNPHFHSKYASYESVRDAVTPHLAAQGLLVLQTFEPSVPADAGPIIVTTLLHVSGESVQSRLFLPASKKDAQGFGSCITYGRRYSLQSICGIGGEEDDDGNGASGRPAPVQRNERSATPPPAARPNSTPAQQAATTPPLSTGRREIGEKLMACAKNDRARYKGFLSCIIPGKTAVAQLTDPEVEICKLVITAAVDIQIEQDIVLTMQALQSTIKAKTPVHQWTPNHVEAAYLAIRGTSTPTNAIPPGHSAANLQPDDCPF